MSELELTVSRTIPASREKVFNAWLSPDLMAKFMRPPSGESAVSRVANDPVKGGRFSIVMVMPDKEVAHAGTYLAIDPHSHLSFTWESPLSLDDSVVTIDFAEPRAGVTDITLRHVKFRSEQARDGHRRGWSAIIENCAGLLELA
ncbi:SRPBCC domain-containing protein [Rhizobium sp. RU36D]|uniref:SRPBCC family protein n=1 Tax=Rhizobium sp. RU36D TaxID=1907415 RepID=UPI000A02948A|nr:SRPBCC domain-containing protein [Rhizobium sp. RU36D]